MHKQIKNSPKHIIEDVKKRRQTINVSESEYHLPEKYRSPKTQKKQLYIHKEFKTQYKDHKTYKTPYTESKKQSRVSSLAPNESDITPKKLLFYHIDSSQSKQRPLRKIHSISLVDTPKKLNLKKRTDQHLFTVQQERDKDGCKKIVSASKISSKNNYSKALRISSSKLHEDVDIHDATSSQIKSSKKHYSRNNDNYDIYYNEGGHNGSSQNLKSSKKIIRIHQTYTQNHINSYRNSIVDKQKSSRTLRITRNSRSSNNNVMAKMDSMTKKNDPQTNNTSNRNNKNNTSNSKNNTKSNKKIKSPRVQEFEMGSNQYSSFSTQVFVNEKKLQTMFLKCNMILKTYCSEMQKLKVENENLKKENQYLRRQISETN